MTSFGAGRGTLIAAFRCKLLVFLVVNLFLVPTLVIAEDEQLGTDEEASNDSDDSYDDDFLRKYALDVHLQTDCRDRPNEIINCTKVLEKGFCDVQNAALDLMNSRALCPATCKTCNAMPTRTSIWVDHDCYDHGEDMNVYFSNTDPEPDDYLVIHLKQHEFTEEVAVMWLYACGNVNQVCRSSSGGVIFGERGVRPDARWKMFPLEQGRYIATLVRGNGGVLAESFPFTVKPHDQSCAEECQDKVFSDQVCYEDNELIHFTFDNCVPHTDDHVAIYPEEEADPGLHEPLLWLGACGDHHCEGEITSDVVSFGKEDQLLKGRGKWPLPAGNYIAAVMRTDEGGRYGRAIVSSSGFEIAEPGKFCEYEYEYEYEDEDEL